MLKINNYFSVFSFGWSDASWPLARFTDVTATQMDVPFVKCTGTAGLLCHWGGWP